MKKLIIICEGQTEEAFCDKILKPHLAGLNIDIEYPLIAHSGGGIVKWPHLKKQIELHHASENNAYITTFIDYYGIEAHHNFPAWGNAHLEGNKSLRMGLLENAMSSDLIAAIRPQFIPNIQLHEFEALILSDHSAFGTYYAPSEFDSTTLALICAKPPETINDGINSAPSKRLKANIPSYDKVNDGPELASIIGLNRIQAQCPRFNNWITALENI